jgi:hypothetical protein
MSNIPDNLNIPNIEKIFDDKKKELIDSLKELQKINSQEIEMIEKLKKKIEESKK